MKARGLDVSLFVEIPRARAGDDIDQHVADWVNDFKNDTTSQLGLSIIRVEVRVEGQSAWGTEKANASGAKARGAKYAIASPWTPPASMKTNNNTVGSSLNTGSYADYAAYLKSFADYMGSAVDVISLQNEPNIQVTYVSCSWTLRA